MNEEDKTAKPQYLDKSEVMRALDECAANFVEAYERGFMKYKEMCDMRYAIEKGKQSITELPVKEFGEDKVQRGRLEQDMRNEVNNISDDCVHPKLKPIVCRNERHSDGGKAYCRCCGTTTEYSDDEVEMDVKEWIEVGKWQYDDSLWHDERKYVVCKCCGNRLILSCRQYSE